MPDCVHCQGVVAPDGHCWDCGADQPAYRSHLELETQHAAAVTDRGHHRIANADAMALLTLAPWTIGVVCDGVSMSARPERAAQLAAETGAATLSAHLLACRLGPPAETVLIDLTGRVLQVIVRDTHSVPGPGSWNFFSPIPH